MLQDTGSMPMLYANLSTNLLEREVYIEELMCSEGLLRHYREVDQAKSNNLESATSYGKLCLRQYIQPVSESIAKELNKIRSGGSGIHNAICNDIIDMSSEVLAFLTLRGIIDSIHREPTLMAVSVSIGGMVEDEYTYASFAEKNAKAFQYALKRAQKNTTYERRAKALNAMMLHTAEGRYGNQEDGRLARTPWQKDKLFKIGTKLITLALRHAPIAKIVDVKGAKAFQTVTRLIPTPEFREWVQEITEKSALLAPITLPCVIPPKHHTTPTDGGYHTAVVKNPCLIKTKDSAYIAMLAEKKEQMQPIYDAVNTAQDTPWRINRRVYDTLKTLWDAGYTGAGMPHQDEQEMPRCPKCGRQVKTDGKKKHACFEKDPDVLRQWKQHAATIHASNARAFSKRLMFHRILWAADLYIEDERIYFPYQLDFRGRLYAVPQFLNPQGHDVSKGLLEFAEGKPIETPEAANWLAIHVANTWGEDKASFADRIHWVEENAEMIQNIASDPITYKDWADADSPYCFLAACLEWAAFTEQGFGFVSHIPIAQDGTCSGLQHYSAILRDPVGGTATNLIPHEKPQDIYAVVAQRTLEALSRVDVYDENYALAQQWLNSALITRKTTKRAVMTLPYGSTLYSAKKYIREWLEEVREKAPSTVPWSIEESGAACSYLGKIVWGAIRETVTAAAQAMDWLKDVAHIVTDANLPLAWTSPSGMPVVQRYMKLEHRRVNTFIAGGSFFKTTEKRKTIQAGAHDDPIRIRLTLAEETDQIDSSKNVTGLAPNFIHSMDAAAMVFAVLKAKEHGVGSYALIHDSFATHAADSQQLAEDLRDAFVEMYEKYPVLDELAAGLERLLPPDYVAAIPPLPRKGALNLGDIRRSLYFFA